MNKADIQIPTVTRHRVEKAHAMALHGQRTQQLRLCESGMRLARAGHPKLLLALEKGLEELDKMVEQQYGRTRRDTGTDFSHRVTPTEQGLWRGAYETMDSGTPSEAFAWIYGGAAWMAGLIEGIRVAGR